MSPREKEVVALLRQAKTNKEIGKVLHLSHRTIDDYINQLKIKLGCSKKSQIIQILNSYSK